MSILDYFRADEAEPAPIGASALSIDALLDAISNARRRAVIAEVEAALEANELPLTLRELSRSVATREVGPNPSSEERKRVYVALYQTHLATLDDAAIIEYDERANKIDIGDEFSTAYLAIQEIRDIMAGGAP